MMTPRTLTGNLLVPAIIFLHFAAFALLPSGISAQTQIWGTTLSGGPDALGTLFNLYDDGSGYSEPHEFRRVKDGTYPKTPLALRGGAIYGISSAGGLNNGGTFFKFNGDSLTVLAHLSIGEHGNEARGELLDIADETWLTTTFSGAEHGVGAILGHQPDGELTVLAPFQNSTTGGNPSGALAYDEISQNVYGTCSSGGNASSGTLYVFNTEEQEITALHHFAGDDGGTYPLGGVLLASDGLLYGTTQYGGSSGQGTLFSFDPSDGTFQTIHHFEAGHGRYPHGSLVESSPGVLMGVCSEGGAFSTGTIFKCTTDGNFTILKNLSPSTDGGYPKSALASDGNGNLLGTTEFGGSHGYGTLYSITESGSFSLLHHFDYTADGSNPIARVTFDQGTAYGVCAGGGASSRGTLFSYTASTYEKIHDFNVSRKGANPAGLNYGETGFIGVTKFGGATNNGVIFRTEISGQTTVLHSLDGTVDGSQPNGTLTPLGGGVYMGTCRSGGLDGAGTLFSISDQGEFQLIHTFSATDGGKFPSAPPVLHSNSKLYGTTMSGGSFGDGVLYELDENLNYSTLYDLFGYFDGGAPQAGLTEGSDGLLYGLGGTAGLFNGGTLFRYDPNGAAPEILHHFNPNETGQYPLATLLLHSDGNLYGTTTQGSSLGSGTIFRYSDDGGLEVLHSFLADDGANAVGALAESTDGTLYGFAQQAGAYAYGTCFKYHPEEGFSTIYSFDAPQGVLPTGSPVLHYPECISDDQCTTNEACAFARCIFGSCQEFFIQPQFAALEIGLCEEGLDRYDLTLAVSLSASPGGQLQVEGQTFDLDPDQTEYVFELTDLTPTGGEIDLPYTFTETECGGFTGVLGISPLPCPPTLITFVLDAGGMDPAEDVYYLGGNFQGWTPAENPMTETAPGIWQATLDMVEGQYEFNFFSGPSIFDAEYVVGPCATNGKRQLTVGETGETLYYCLHTCAEECSSDGLGEAGSATFSLRPNLVKPGAYMELRWGGPRMEDHSYRVLDSKGQTVARGTLTTGKRNRVPVGEWSAGMYVLIIESADRDAVRAARFAVR